MYSWYTPYFIRIYTIAYRDIIYNSVSIYGNIINTAASSCKNAYSDAIQHSPLYHIISIG